MLIGSPIAGAILDGQSVGNGAGGLVVGQEVYWGTFVFTGMILVASTICLIVTRVLKAGFAWKKC